jgi:hypothetical protein
VLIRQNGPVFGSSNPYAPPGETQVNISTRNLRSTDHYNGTEEQLQRQEQGTYVINMQHAIDVSVTHVFTERFSVGVGVPFIAASWGIPSPFTGGEAARKTQNASGIGDISVAGRYWLLPTSTFKTGNIALGVGFKMPTGNHREVDTYPNIQGLNEQEKPVDQSVQTSDGGWGIMLDLQGFKRVKYAQLFGSASYLANPRDTNDTTSIAVNISATPAIALAGPTAYNSVPDQYMARLGAAFPMGKSGFVSSLTWRVEGLPRYDLFGKSHGFRRPGVEMFIEPGLTYAKGSHVYSVQVPIGYYRNRFPNPYTGIRGDATFPKYIVLASYGFRFGSSVGPSDAAIQ